MAHYEVITTIVLSLSLIAFAVLQMWILKDRRPLSASDFIDKDRDMWFTCTKSTPEPDVETVEQSLADIKAGRFRSIEEVIADGCPEKGLKWSRVWPPDERIIGEA